MNIMVFGQGGAKQLSLGAGTLAALVAALLLLVAGGGFTGWHLAQTLSANQAMTAETQQVARWKQRVQQQQDELAALERKMNQQVDGLTLRLGQMQARIMRLDALGQRLVVSADIGNDEFDFESVPAMGGVAEEGMGESYSLSELDAMIASLDNRLSSRAKQLDLLDDLMANRTLENQRHVAGRPVTWGWVSSQYGYRTDPFHGRRTWHSGVDIAGKEGGDVISVGAGVVTVAEDRGGYGYFVEIEHGDGLTTRYAHAKELLVEPGQVVSRGELIALMGSTGRSTGPHVHFEVLKNGTRQDPEVYMQRASR